MLELAPPWPGPQEIGVTTPFACPEEHSNSHKSDISDPPLLLSREIGGRLDRMFETGIVGARVEAPASLVLSSTA